MSEAFDEPADASGPAPSPTEPDGAAAVVDTPTDPPTTEPDGAEAAVNEPAEPSSTEPDGAEAAVDEPLVDARRLLAVADGPPLAPWEPDEADRGPLMPLELLGWDADDRLVGVRSDADALLLRGGRPAVRRPLQVERVTQWARAGRITLHTSTGDVEVRLLSPEEYAGLSVGDGRQGRVAGPLRAVRSASLAARRDDVGRVLVQRVRRLFPDVQVGTG